MTTSFNVADKISFLRRVFGGADVAANGLNLAVMCPNRQCKSRFKGKKKLSIRIDTDQSHCWVCGLKTHDSLIPVLKIVGSRSDVQEYIEKFRVNTKERNTVLSESGESEDEIVKLPGDFRVLAMNRLSKDPSVLLGLNYLRSRGLSDRDLWFYKIGISNEPEFRRRVIFPSFDADGFLNFYSARTIGDGPGRKYQVPSAKRVSVIFNELNIRWDREITLVEGPFDLVKCDHNATCLQGSDLSEDFLLFWKIVEHRTPVVLALDADAQGKAHKYAEFLSLYDVPVRMLELGRFKDVGEMNRSDFQVAKQCALPWNRTNSLKWFISNISDHTGSAV